MIRLFAALILIVTFSQVALARLQSSALSTPEDFKNEFAVVPCNNEDRREAVMALFKRMGASDPEITIEKYKNVENVVIRKRGMSDGEIIVGAHYDKVEAGCGAIDNWTGIVTIAHMYRFLKELPLNRTIQFVAFGKEEFGLVGSHAMAEAINKDAVANYCAMINVDSLGLAAPQVLDNTSSEDLRTISAEIASNLNIPFGHARIEGADADSSSFLRRKIPSVTIHGMTNDWPKILHSTKDEPSIVNQNSVYLGYRLALALVTRTDKERCDVYR
jgi:Zn-dependent M28 family amino/carboxypeptidase